MEVAAMVVVAPTGEVRCGDGSSGDGRGGADG